MALSLCSSAIETTFPMSNFKTNHIFGILMAWVKSWHGSSPFGAPQAPQFFFTTAEGGVGRRSK